MKISKKIFSIAIISSLTVVMFVGCSNYKKTANYPSNGTSNGIGMNGTPGIGATAVHPAAPDSRSR